MDFKEAMEYIDGTLWFGSKPGLERVAELLRRLGEPQKDLKFVHIAGTNGKGSCAAMTASVLRAAGYRTGLFTSPYLFRFNERMQINGEEIPNGALTRLIEKIKPIAEAMDEHPTEFELITAAAMLWYQEEGCHIVVLEVGLGGRLDATNIIGAPEAAVIMNIGLDHTEILGDTVEKIAAEKAGIIKPGAPCVLYGQSEAVEAVIRQKCRETGSELILASPAEIDSEFDSPEGQVFSYKGRRYALPLLGEHQLKNAAVVIETAKLLNRRGWQISDEAIERGLYAVSWPARFEILRHKPCFIVDGGHNPQCAVTVAENLQKYFPGKKHVLLIGVLADKDYAGLTELLAPAADEFVCVTPDSPRALSAAALAEHLRRYGKPVTACESIEEGVAAASHAAGEEGVACAVGSLYMAGKVRACFGLY